MLSLFFYNNYAFFLQSRQNNGPESLKYLNLSIRTLKSLNGNRNCRKEDDDMESIKYLFPLVKLQLQLIEHQKSVPDFDLSLKSNKKCLGSFSLLINKIISFQLKTGVPDEVDENFVKNSFLKFLHSSAKLNLSIQEFLYFTSVNDESHLRENRSLEKFTELLKHFPRVKLNPIWINQVNEASFLKVEFISWERIKRHISPQDVCSEVFLSLLVILQSLLCSSISKTLLQHH